MTRFIDRQAKQPEAATTKPIESPAANASRPWLGESLAARVSSPGFRVLTTAGLGAYRTAISLQCWNNLPILNEWHRLYPDRDPAAVHEAVWGERLDLFRQPAQQRYVWNPKWRTMESTVLGHPQASPNPGLMRLAPLRDLKSADFGISLPRGRPGKRCGRDRTANEALTAAVSFDRELDE